MPVKVRLPHYEIPVRHVPCSRSYLTVGNQRGAEACGRLGSHSEVVVQRRKTRLIHGRSKIDHHRRATYYFHRDILTFIEPLTRMLLKLNLILERFVGIVCLLLKRVFFFSFLYIYYYYYCYYCCCCCCCCCELERVVLYSYGKTSCVLVN